MDVVAILTVIGTDRPGIVRELAAIVAEYDGNWVESRLARLGGRFAGVVRVVVAEEQWPALAESLQGLQRNGLRVTAEPLTAEPALAGDWQWVSLELTGADHVGIVRRVTEALSNRGVNVDDLQTGIEEAPWSGEPLFRAKARLGLPVGLSLQMLRDELESVAADLMVDLQLRE